LGERLADDRPGVLDAEARPDLLAVGVGGLGGDAVHHRVGEPHLALDPVAQLGVAQPREGAEHLPAQVPVALQVVARHHRERRQPALPPPPQRLHDQAEGGPRHRIGPEVGDHAWVGLVELRGGGVEVVAALRDGERDDPRRLVRHLLDHRLGVVGREQVLGDRADHPRLVGPVAALDHQRVEAVLRVERLLHAPVGRHHPDPADAPVQRLALVHEAIEVHRLVRAVEAAHAEVHDAGADAAAVVGRRGDVELGQRLAGEPHVTIPRERPCMSSCRSAKRRWAGIDA
jgi:hypothetical protein